MATTVCLRGARAVPLFQAPRKLSQVEPAPPCPLNASQGCVRLRERLSLAGHVLTAFDEAWVPIKVCF
jgi:hypothetical protein